MKRQEGEWTIYTATLPYPTGINSTYGGRGGGLRKTAKALKWFKDCILALRSQGFEPLPDRTYWAELRYGLWTVQMDCDGPSKPIIDAVAKALSLDTSYVKLVQSPRTKKWRKVKVEKWEGFNDRYVGRVHSVKHRVSHYKDQRLTVEFRLKPVKDWKEWNTITDQRIESCPA